MTGESVAGWCSGRTAWCREAACRRRPAGPLHLLLQRATRSQGKKACLQRAHERRVVASSAWVARQNQHLQLRRALRRQLQHLRMGFGQERRNTVRTSMQDAAVRPAAASDGLCNA